MKTALLTLALLLCSHQACSSPDTAAREIYAELIGIDTTQSTGNTTVAAQAVARRLLAAGFDARDVEVIGPTPERGNLLARLRGDGSRPPLLLMAHLDVVDVVAAEWTVPPLQLTETDGYFYGRGTSDDKAMAAAFVANLIAMAQSGHRPSRDIYLALTADEEGGTHDGVQWLLANRPVLRTVAFALNEGGHGTLVDGKPALHIIEYSQKINQNYRVEASGPGGHSALPAGDNPIYRLAAGLARVQAFAFPARAGEGTREYFRQMSAVRGGMLAQDLEAVLEDPPDPVAQQRIADVPELNAALRTTCVATRFEAGHADNAIPMRATALLNCRILPQESVESVTRTLARVLGDDRLTLTPIGEAVLSPPSPLDSDAMAAIRSISEAMWPGVPVVPAMSLGYTDARHTRNAGIATYGVSGAFFADADRRAHGKDERMPVRSFAESREFLDRLVRALAE